MFTLSAGRSLDPLGVLSLPRVRTIAPIQTVQRSEPRYDISHMNALLGFNPQKQTQVQTRKIQPRYDTTLINSLLDFQTQSTTKPRKNSKNSKKKVFNYFTNRWE